MAIIEAFIYKLHVALNLRLSDRVSRLISIIYLSLTNPHTFTQKHNLVICMTACVWTNINGRYDWLNKTKPMAPVSTYSGSGETLGVNHLISEAAPYIGGACVFRWFCIHVNLGYQLSAQS